MDIHPLDPVPEGIYKTSAYDDFKFLAENRDISDKHVTALMKAFKEYGNLTKASPILVNESLEVIDGQNRLLAAKALGQPVWYRVYPGLSAHDARAINLYHRNWGPEDFAKSYAARGLQAYRDYLKLKEDYELTFKIISCYIYGGTEISKGRNSISAQFRSGDLEIEDMEATKQWLDRYLEALPYLPGKHSIIALAFLKVMRNPAYDHKQMMKKLKLFGGNMKSYTSQIDNVRQLEEVYNFRQHEENKTRLY